MQIRIAVSLGATVVSLVPCSWAQPAFTDANWIGLGGYAGVNGTISATVVDTNSGLVYFGGSFTVAGRTGVSNIAAWDGTNWLALGAGMNSNVYCLASDGTGKLYAGGNFTKAGGVAVNHIAKWDGTNWSTVSLGTDGEVSALAIDPAGNLYAGGSFVHAGGITASNIAKWDGASWSNLGLGINSINSTVLSLACDATGKVYAGGYFVQAGGIRTPYIAKWDGTNWSGLGNGWGEQVLTMALDNTGNLYAGGYGGPESLTPFGGPVSRWDGTNWYSLNTIAGLYIYSLAVDRGGNLYASGQHGGAPIAKWNGTNWQTLGAGLNGVVYASAVDDAGNLYAGGYFNSAGNVAVNGAARWDGTNWSALNAGAIPQTGIPLALQTGDSRIQAVASLNTLLSYNQYVVLEKWDGGRWQSSVIASSPNYPSYNTLTFDRSGNLFAGGIFTNAAGGPINNAAERNGTNWTALGIGFGGPVLSLSADKAGNLYAGGSFRSAGGALATNVARWDGTNWSALGAGLGGAVGALTVDQTGNVHAGMCSSSTNGNPVTFAKWDGTNWSSEAAPLNINTNSGPFAIAVDAAGRLYVGGEISLVSTAGALMNGIARWDGTNWSTLGSGLGTNVSVIAYDNNGHLFAGGNFAMAGTNYAYGFAEAIIGVATNPPVLSIANASAGNVGLSWPLDHRGWRLQAQRNAPGVGITTNWFTIAGSTNVNATNFPVNPGAGSVFYRLVYP